jgi:hypothetical protein
MRTPSDLLSLVASGREKPGENTLPKISAFKRTIIVDDSIVRIRSLHRSTRFTSRKRKEIALIDCNILEADRSECATCTHDKTKKRLTTTANYVVFESKYRPNELKNP